MAGNAGAIKAGRAFVEVFADQTKLEKDLTRTEKRLKAWANSATAAGKALGLAGAAITAPLGAAAKVFADMGSELNDMSARTGLSVEALSQLSYAAGQSGTDMETLEGGIRKMQKALTLGSEENQAAAGTFAMLGFSIRQLQQMNPEQQFELIAKRIGAIRDPTLKAGAAMQIFGKSGTSLLPMISEFDDLTGAARKLGLMWTGEEAKKADALGDAISMLTASMKRLTATVGGALAPRLIKFNEMMANAAKVAGDWIREHEGLVVVALQIGTALTAAGSAVIAFGLALRGVASAVALVNASIKVTRALAIALSSPWVAIAAAVGVAAAMFLEFTETGQKIKSSVTAALKDLLKTATETFKGISDALKAGDIQLAAKILWAGLKVEWQKGATYLRAVWKTIFEYASDTFRGITFNLASAFIDGLADMKNEWNNFITEVKGGGLAAMALIRIEWAKLRGDMAGAQKESDALVHAWFELGQEQMKARDAIEAQRKGSQAALLSQREADTKEIARQRTKGCTEQGSCCGSGRARQVSRSGCESRGASPGCAGRRPKGRQGTYTRRH